MVRGVGKLTVQAPGEFKVGGCVMNAPGGDNASGMNWCSTKCIQRVRGPLSVGLWGEEVDEMQAIVVRPLGTCLKAAEHDIEFV